MTMDSAFLGTGWSFPPTFQAGGQAIEMVSGELDIHQSLQILLSTRQGERVIRDDFGCDLNDLLFEEIDQHFLNRLSGLVSDAILKYESRIILNDIVVMMDTEDQGRLLIHINYSIPTTNSRFNMVYPFYLNEANFFGG